MYRIGKLYRLIVGKHGISAFADYETLNDWANGFAVNGGENITGYFMVIEKKFVGINDRIHLRVLYEDRYLWIDATAYNCEFVGED